MAYTSFSPLSQVPQPIKISRFDVPSGNAGVGRTLELMRGLALGGEGAQNSQIRQLASRILVENHIPARDESAEAHSLSGWVHSMIRFTGEHNDATQESLQTSVVTLRMRTGDCDDFAILLSSLLHSVGIINDFHVVKPRGRENDPTAPWSHVYVVATNKRTGERLMLDPTLDDASGYQFNTIQANAGGAEFGLGQLKGIPGQGGLGSVCPRGGLGCADCNGSCKGGSMAGLGDLASTLTNVLDSPAITAIAQGEATNIAYGNRSTLTTLQSSTAANPFATPAQLQTGASGTLNSLAPQIPAWLWIAGVALGGIVLIQLVHKKG